MKSVALMSCLCLLAVILHAQGNRVRSGTPLRWAMNGSVEIMEGDLTQYYGSNDSNKVYRLSSTYASPTLANSKAIRFSSVQALCQQNGVQITWSALQEQYSADRYEIEQSADGYQWMNLGTMPANRTEVGEASYNFSSTRNASNALYRITAINATGEKTYSSIIQSPCSATSYLAVSANPVYSTTSIRVGTPVATKVKLLLLNSNGVVMQTRDATLGVGTNQVPVDMSGMAPGFYSVVIQWLGGKTDIIKLVKQ
jgi:hypothetical protein